MRRARPGPDVLAEFVEVTTTRLAQEAGSPRRNGRPSAGARSGSVPTPSSWRCASSTAGCTSRTSGAPSIGPVAAAGLRPAMALDRVQDAMPFVVGKQAGCPDGTAVRFDCQRSRGRRTLLHRGGRGWPGVAGRTRWTPTVTLSLSSLDFVRLGCGRATAAQVEAAGRDRHGRRRGGRTQVLGP